MTSSKDRETRCVASLDDGKFDEAMDRVLQQDRTAYDLVVCGDVTLFVAELCACTLERCMCRPCQCMRNHVESPDLKSDRSCHQNSRSYGQKSSNGTKRNSARRVLCRCIDRLDPHLISSSLGVLQMPLTQVRWAESDAVRMDSRRGWLRLFESSNLTQSIETWL